MTAFVYGFRLEELAETEAKCKNSPLTSCQNVSYYLGRIVRVIVSIPGSILFVVGQILSFIGSTLELPTVKLESKIRNIPPEQTTSLYLISNYGINRFIQKCNKECLYREQGIFASSLYCYIPGNIERSVNIYSRFLYKSLFTTSECWEIWIEIARIQDNYLTAASK